MELPESFYELSGDELKMLMAQQSRRRQEMENQPLKTRKIREKEAEAHRQKYPKTQIRFRFREDSSNILQAVFLSSEPLTALYEFVASSITFDSAETETYGFDLFLPGKGKLSPDDDKDMFDAGLSPSSLIIVEIKSKKMTINEDVLAAASASGSSTNPSYSNAPTEVSAKDQDEGSSSSSKWFDSISDWLVSPIDIIDYSNIIDGRLI